MSRWILAVLFSASSFAFADIEILSVTGVSNFIDGSSNSHGTPVVYGGVGGDQFNCTDDMNSISLCNNCEELIGAWEVCNEKRIYNSLVLSITFRSDSPESLGRAFLRNSDGHSLNGGVTPVLAAGAIHTVRILWRDVCEALRNGASTCELMNEIAAFSLNIEKDGDIKDSQSVTFVVSTPDRFSNFEKATIDLCEASAGTDSQGGVCDFKVKSSPGRNYIESITVNGSFPNEDGVQLQALRLFVSDESFDALSGPGVGPRLLREDLALSIYDDGTVDYENNISGLIPGTRYFFKMGVVDLAGNLTRVTSDSAITSSCGSTSTPNDECPFSMTTMAR